MRTHAIAPTSRLLSNFAKEIHYLIDRKNEYYFLDNLHLPHHADPDGVRYHKDTLLDGELVSDREDDGSYRLRYLVFDCLVLDGENLINKPFDKRIGRYHSFVDGPFKKLFKRYPQELVHLPFDVTFKVMEKPYALEAMFKDKLPKLRHGNDGLIFTCKGTTYVSGTDEHILKWKPAHENSIDFKLVLEDFPVDVDGDEDYDAKPPFTLQVWHGNGQPYTNFAPLYITDDEWECMKALHEQLDGRIIECYRDELGRWRYKAESNGAPRFRDDKENANHISTVNKVLESIEDGVSEEELLAAAPGIQRAWKQRHPEERQMAQRPPPGGVNGHAH
jgi:mRNA guanylyltransferase